MAANTRRCKLRARLMGIRPLKLKFMLQIKDRIEGIVFTLFTG
jgi:hypothetical protein